MWCSVATSRIFVILGFFMFVSLIWNNGNNLHKKQSLESGDSVLFGKQSTFLYFCYIGW
jgi:hypothetical protein